MCANIIGIYIYILYIYSLLIYKYSFPYEEHICVGTNAQITGTKKRRTGHQDRLWHTSTPGWSIRVSMHTICIYTLSRTAKC